MPGDAAGAAARGAALEAELAAGDREHADADAQHRLYTLLGERTRCAPRRGRHTCPKSFCQGNFLCCCLYYAHSIILQQQKHNAACAAQQCWPQRCCVQRARADAGRRRARRREHMAMDAQVRAARAAADNYAEDIAATTAHVHAAAAAREDAKRDLAVCRHQVRVQRLCLC